MGTLEVAKFYELMTKKSRIAVGDDEVSFTLFYRKAGSDFGGPGAGGIDEDAEHS